MLTADGPAPLHSVQQDDSSAVLVATETVVEIPTIRQVEIPELSAHKTG